MPDQSDGGDSGDASPAHAQAADTASADPSSTEASVRSEDPLVLMPKVRGVAAMMVAEHATTGPLRRQYQARSPRVVGSCSVSCSERCLRRLRTGPPSIGKLPA